MPFDPDAYLQQKQGGFNPDQYLAGKTQPAPQNDMMQRIQKKLAEKQIFSGGPGPVPPDVPMDAPGGGVQFSGEQNKPKEYTPAETMKGIGETALTTLTGATGGTAGMMYGTLKGILDSVARGDFGTDEAVKRIEQSAAENAQALTYEPKTPAGKEFTQKTGEALAPLQAVSPMALQELASITAASRAFRGIPKGSQLIDEQGSPTKILKKALNKQGLDFEDLTPEAKAMIPKYAERGILSSAKGLDKTSEQALVQQIESGGRSDALATLKAVGGEVRPDKVAKEAVRQGYSPGLVQAVKTSSPATRKKMADMLRIMRRIKKNERVALDTRPSDVVGKSLINRVDYIRKRANEARDRLNQIAKTNLKGKRVNFDAIDDTLQKHIDDLGVRVTRNSEGKLAPDFENSVISENPVAQKAVRSAINLLSKKNNRDALSAHMLKRQFDTLIDFNKAPQQGLKGEGMRVLKDMRKQLNTIIREADDEYAKVNDTLSKSLDAINSLDDSVGSIDIFSEGADKALGTRLRALMSNQQGRIKMENAVNSVSDAAEALGGKFNDDLKDLAMFSNALDERFGAVAKTSFSGQTEQAARQVASQGIKSSIYQQAGEIASKGVEKARGINDFNAFNAMEELIKRK